MTVLAVVLACAALVFAYAAWERARVTARAMTDHGQALQDVRAELVAARPGSEPRVRVRMSGLVEEAIERGIRYGCRRAYKHRTGSIPDDVVADIAREGTSDAMTQIGEFLVLDAWEES